MDYMNMPREQFVDQLLYAMRQGLTMEMYDKLRAALLAMPENIFLQFMAEAKEKALRNGVSAKSCSDALKAVLATGKVTSENSAMNRMPVKFLDEKENEALWKDILLSRPDDRICLKRADDKALCELWMKGSSVPKGSLPSDLFFAGNIPLMDCEIVVDETDEPDGVVCSYRVVVFPDYRERIEASDDDTADVGALVMDIKGYDFVMPISVCKGIDTILTGPLGYRNVPAGLRAMCEKEWTQASMLNMGYEYLITWYGIQVALLHPTVRNVFQNPRSEAVYAPSGKKGKARRFVRYIRRHIISAEDIRHAAYGANREYERHTLVWYVIGHWRKYADGRRVFIQPYWKGALRRLKMSLDGRDRQIVL